jgi:branched-chain amino acid transport system permease protein
VNKKKINTYRGNLILIALIIAFPLITRNAYHTNVMIFLGIYTLLALGLTLLLGYAGQISLGQAGFYGVGAYICGILTTRYGLNPWMVLPIALGIAAIFAFIVGYSTLYLTGLYLAMATLGIGIIFTILFTELKDLTGGGIGLSNIPSLSIAGIKLNTDLSLYILVWLIVIIIYFFVTNLVNSRVGRAMRAIQGNEIASDCMGIDSFKYKLKVFIFGAVLAALSGFLYAHYVTYLSPSAFTFNSSILFFVMAIVGGRESIWGALYGAAALLLLQESLRAYENLYTMLYGIILIVFVVFFNRGIAGGLDIFKRKLRGKFRIR